MSFARPTRLLARLIRSHICLAMGLAGLSLAAQSTVLAADAPLTLAEAQRRALAHSRQLPAKDFAALASREAAIAAGQLPDPVLKIGIDNLPASGPDRFSVTQDFMTMRRVGVMQEITRGDKRRLRAERLRQGADKAVD